jgi:hypothetical protein
MWSAVSFTCSSPTPDLKDTRIQHARIIRSRNLGLLQIQGSGEERWDCDVLFRLIFLFWRISNEPKHTLDRMAHLADALGFPLKLAPSEWLLDAVETGILVALTEGLTAPPWSGVAAPHAVDATSFRIRVRPQDALPLPRRPERAATLRPPAQPSRQ